MKHSRLLWPILLIILVVIYGYFYWQIQDQFGPYYGDEYFYWKNAQSAATNGPLQASFTYSGKGSLLGGFDAHGPAYPLLYGWLGFLGNIHPLGLFWVNWLLVIGSMVVLMLSKVSFGMRRIIWVLLLASPMVLFYGFTLMPELIHLAGGILLLLAIQGHFSAPKSSKTAIWLAILLVLGMIRSTWFLAAMAWGIYALFQKEHWKGWGLLILGGVLAWFFQHYLHESVPNVFASTMDQVRVGDWKQILVDLSYNTKRNLYFLGTYSEGYFYIAWKIWLLGTPLWAWIWYRKDPVIQVSLGIFFLQFIFSLVLYKTYAWTEFRMLSPVVFMIHLQILLLSKGSSVHLVPMGLLAISFLLLLPFQQKITDLRTQYAPKAIPAAILSEIQTLDKPLIRLDTLVIQEYDVGSLPIQNQTGSPLRYILPFYALSEAISTHHVKVQEDQLIILSEKIRNQ